MKNTLLILTVLSLTGGALAASTTVVQPVNAEVKNVCTYNSTSTAPTTNPPVDPAAPGVPLNMVDVNGRTYTQGNYDLGNYRANAATGGSVGVYIFRCTVGTSWNSPAYTTPRPVTLYLNGNTSNANPLVAGSLVTEFKTPDNGNNVGDVYAAGVKFDLPAGQYASKAGTYSGKLSITISYN